MATATKTHGAMDRMRGAAQSALRSLGGVFNRAGGGAGEKSMNLGAALAAAENRFASGGDIGAPLVLVEPLDAFQQSLWVNRCVGAILRTGGGIPLRFARAGAGLKFAAKSFRPEIRRCTRRTLRPLWGSKSVCVGKADENEIVESGPVADLFSRPNELQDWPAFFGATLGFLHARGSAAWIMRIAAGRRPDAIHAVDGRFVTPKVAYDEGGLPVLLGYKYRHPTTGREIPLTPDEVKYFCLWAGTSNPLQGLSPSGPGRYAIATDYAASLFNAAALSNNAEPGLHVDFPQALNPEQREAFKTALRERHGGPTKAKRDLITEGGAKAEAWQTNFQDLQFDQGKKTTRLEICCLIGVPPVVAGWVDAAGDSSAYSQNAMRQFYEQTIMPCLDMFAPAIQEIAARFDAGLVAWFDVEDQPVVQEMRLARLDSATKLFALGNPFNAINDMLDLGMPAQPWGDTGFLPSGLLPATDVASGGGFPATPEGPPPGAAVDDLGQPRSKAGTGNRESGIGEKELAERDARGRIWQAWARSWAPIAQQVRQVLRSRYFALEKAAQAELKRQTGDSGFGIRDSGIGNREKALDPEALVAEIFADPKARAAFRVRIRTALRDGQELGLRQALVESGLTGDALEAALKKLLSNPRLIQGLNADAIIVSTKIDDRTRALLKTQLAEGLNAGETFDQLGHRIEAYFGHRRGQAILVARNTVGQILSTSRHEGYKSVGMTHKVWLHSRAPQAAPRANHIEAEARYARAPCPIDEPFIIHGEEGDVELMYPRDAVMGGGHPEEIVNCQCLQIARRNGDSGFGIRDSGFETHAQMLAARAAREAGPEHGEKDEV